MQGQHLAGAADGAQHIDDVEGLDEVVVGAELHRLHGAVDHVVGAHHQHHRGAVAFLYLPQDLDAIHPGQHNVHQR